MSTTDFRQDSMTIDFCKSQVVSQKCAPAIQSLRSFFDTAQRIFSKKNQAMLKGKRKVYTAVKHSFFPL